MSGSEVLSVGSICDSVGFCVWLCVWSMCDLKVGLLVILCDWFCV